MHGARFESALAETDAEPMAYRHAIGVGVVVGTVWIVSCETSSSRQSEIGSLRAAPPSSRLIPAGNGIAEVG